MTDYVPMAFELETERLVLRPWSVTDAEWYRQLLAERNVPAPELDKVRDFLTGAQERAAATGIAALPVVRKQEGDPIGYCGLVVGRSTLEEPEIAYELFRHVHGRGYATEAATAVLDAAVATGRRRPQCAPGTPRPSGYLKSSGSSAATAPGTTTVNWSGVPASWSAPPTVAKRQEAGAAR
jgi:hypothetical protein